MGGCAGAVFLVAVLLCSWGQRRHFGAQPAAPQQRHQGHTHKTETPGRMYCKPWSAGIRSNIRGYPQRTARQTPPGGAARRTLCAARFRRGGGRPRRGWGCGRADGACVRMRTGVSGGVFDCAFHTWHVMASCLAAKLFCCSNGEQGQGQQGAGGAVANRQGS